VTDKTGALKAELMAQAEAAIDQLLAARRQDNSLREIVALVAESGQAIQQQMTQRLLRVESAPGDQDRPVQGVDTKCATKGRKSVIL
jgi:hypothetical protein